MNFIDISKLSPQSRAAICEFLDSIGRIDQADRTFWEFEEFCALWFRLRAATDTAILFPRGKWATLQRMQDIIDGALREEK